MPCPYFNPRGLRRPRRSGSGSSFHMFIFQSTRPSQTSTTKLKSVFTGETISIHEAFADLDAAHCVFRGWGYRFQSTRPSQTSTQIALSVCGSMLFQSTRPSQTSTNLNLLDGFRWNFNPRGLRRPRLKVFQHVPKLDNFNPRGLRRPRQSIKVYQ